MEGKTHFNSRPSARGDASHALVIWRCCSISIHAPPRGATLTFPDLHGRGLFQFTPLREGRRIRFKSTIFPSRISIHAPPRGATILQAVTFHASPHFNSRPSARGDVYSHLAKLNGEFQFTPLREGRPEPPAEAPAASNFNSRPSARGDCTSSLRLHAHCRISIHAPPRGATAHRHPVFYGG